MNAITLLLISISFLFSNYNQFNQAFIDVSKQQSPAIVSIISEKTEQVNNMFFFNPFDDFGFEQNPHQQERKAQSLGSGVIIDKDKGYIITNAHVIDQAEEVKVVLFDKRELDAKIIATDPLSDIAVIQIDSNNLQQANPGNSTNLQIGEWIIAIGSPFGLHLNHTVTAGIVSATGRSDVISKLNFENFIQHDAAINPGNSGGGLFNLNGDLIGINTAIATDGFSRSNAGVGFAVPINQVMRVVNDLIKEGKVLRGFLGVTIGPIDEDMMKALDLNSKKGVLISFVSPDSPADIANFLWAYHSNWAVHFRATVRIANSARRLSIWASKRRYSPSFWARSARSGLCSQARNGPWAEGPRGPERISSRMACCRSFIWSSVSGDSRSIFMSTKLLHI